MKTYEEICEAVKAECPEMLSDDNVMHDLSCMFNDCSEDKKKAMRQLDDKQYEAYCKVRDRLCTATVGQLIKYLQDNFKLDDKLCYMDCIEGVKNDCTYMTKDQLGDRFFKHVKTLSHSDSYLYVNDNDVIVA